MQKKMIVVLLALFITFLCIYTGTVFAQAETGLSLTTGLPTDAPYRPVLVVISNTPEARRLINFNDADIVYEGIIHGPNMTRYAAIYNDTHPKQVGSVRSARPYHAVMRDEWDCPIVFSANNGWLMRYSIDAYFRDTHLDQSFIFNRSGNFSERALMRTDDINSPHNLAVRLDALVNDLWPADPDDPAKPYEPRANHFIFSDTPSQGAKEINQIDIIYGNANFNASYRYDEALGMYARWYDGYPMINHKTREPVLVSNVIIQRAPHAFMEMQNDAPVIDLIGTGDADFFIDGKMIQGYWTRPSATEATSFYFYDSASENTSPIIFKPGKTFIQLLFITANKREHLNRTDALVYYMEEPTDF